MSASMPEQSASMPSPEPEFQPEMVLRMLLWLNHGHDGLYGDDGEMQCARCTLDFKRDSVEHINSVFARRNLERFRSDLGV